MEPEIRNWPNYLNSDCMVLNYRLSNPWHKPESIQVSVLLFCRPALSHGLIFASIRPIAMTDPRILLRYVLQIESIFWCGGFEVHHLDSQIPWQSWPTRRVGNKCSSLIQTAKKPFSLVWKANLNNSKTEMMHNLNMNEISSITIENRLRQDYSLPVPLEFTTMKNSLEAPHRTPNKKREKALVWLGKSRRNVRKNRDLCN
ncbi:hypothetical protein VNO77_04348 [Canavalia gladiata]|uniref:Uncharacterized protein n=1 Tax=Canavalia gladiata TaxID=3824 RepID=A0AAN9R8Z6_CANGL